MLDPIAGLVALAVRDSLSPMTKCSGKTVLWLLLLLVAAKLPITAAAEASSESGPLRVHPTNPRLLTDTSGRPIILTGSHTWSIFQDLEHDGKRHQPRYGSFRAWLRLLARWDHNFSRGWTWEDGDYSPLPYRRPGGAQWDLEQLNPQYIRRLVSRVEQAEGAGIYTSILLFQGWSVSDKGADDRPRRVPDPWYSHPFSAGRNRNGISADIDGDGRGLELHEAQGQVLAYQKRYVSKLVESMHPLDSIIWEIANEAHADSLAWQNEMVQFIRELESQRQSRHLIWMSCVAGGGADENAALFSGPADIVSPCEAMDAPYVDNPPRSPLGKIVIADSDHIGPGRVRIDWVWKSLLRGLHPIYMDLAADALPWYQGTELGQDPRIADQIRRSLGAVQALVARLPLETMTPQDSAARSPVLDSAGRPPFALYSTDTPADPLPRFDGAALLALEPSGGGTLKVCGLSPASRYLARWLRPVDVTGFGNPERFLTPQPAPGSAAKESLSTREKSSCRLFANPDLDSGKLLLLRRADPEAEETLSARTVQ